MADLLDTRRYLETPEGVEVAVDMAEGPLIALPAAAHALAEIADCEPLDGTGAQPL